MYQKIEERKKNMEVFGFVLPLWALFLLVVFVLIISWKIIKFAIKVLVALLLFFGILIGLDLVGVFDMIQNIFATII